MSIILKIKEVDTFSSSEKAVADYIVNNFDKIKDMNITTLAKKTFTSTSCITRFCKKLGYKGFIEFKQDIINEYIDNNIIHFQENLTAITKENTTEEIIEKLYKFAVDSLTETKLIQSSKLIDTIIEKISKIKIIDIYVLDDSYIVAQDLKYKFQKIGKIVLVPQSTEAQKMALNNCDENHIAIFISKKGEKHEILKMATFLKEKKIVTISMTLYSENLLSNICDYNLYALTKLEKDKLIMTRMGLLLLADILYMCYINKHYEESINNILLIDKM